MAVVDGTVHLVHTLKSDAVDAVQVAEVIFNLSGTYAQADNGRLQNVHTAISSARRNGKSVSLLGAMLSQRALKSSNPAEYLSLKTVAVSGNNVTFELTDNSPTSEFADATAVPAQIRPFGILVAFTES